MRLKIFEFGLLWLFMSIGTVFAQAPSQADVGGGLKSAEVMMPTAAQKEVQPFSSVEFVPLSTVPARQYLQLAATTATATTATATIATTATTAAKTSTTSQNTTSPRSLATESFSSLDRETETLLKEVLNLGSDLSILDEQHANPAKNQLLVLVTLEPSTFFELDYVELKVDDQVVAAHPYTEKEIGALLRGGGHRLYLANLPAGMHHLKAVFVGKIPRDPDYQREASFTFISGVDRTVIELYVNSAENSGFPQFTIKEYN